MTTFRIGSYAKKLLLSWTITTCIDDHGWW
jgi:hypothetical protein